MRVRYEVGTCSGGCNGTGKTEYTIDAMPADSDGSWALDVGTAFTRRSAQKMLKNMRREVPDAEIGVEIP